MNPWQILPRATDCSLGSAGVSGFEAFVHVSPWSQHARTASPPSIPSGLLEYSVVYTDRAPNHNMSQRFQGVMRGTSGILKTTHHAHSAIVVPGSGSFGMEAVARQLAAGQDAGCCVMVGSARRKTKPGWPPRGGFATPRKAFWRTTLRERGDGGAARR